MLNLSDAESNSLETLVASHDSDLIILQNFPSLKLKIT